MYPQALRFRAGRRRARNIVKSASMSPERYRKMQATLARRQPDLTVVMDGVHKPHNLAAIIRSADAVGLDAVHAVSAESSQRFGRKAASGSNKWVRVHQYRRLADCLERVRSDGLRLVAADFRAGAVPFREVDFCQPTALLLGQELDGLSEAAIAAADAFVSVPTIGMIESLNVSVAAALILFEAQRQREAAGLYATPRLPAEEIQTRIFEWAHPQVAQYCQRHGLAYPALDDEGYVVGSLPSVAAGEQYE